MVGQGRDERLRAGFRLAVCICHIRLPKCLFSGA
jgi:hypothetical protein